jgi:hypothetical protein
MISDKLVPIRLALLVAAFLVFPGVPCQAESTQRADSVQDSTAAGQPKHLSKVDSVLVIHFHPTVQCSCCINVGGFSKKSLEEYYAKPYKDGRIIFKEYDVDEDTSTAKKYGIFWSALGFEKFSKGKTEFKEIESVWEFCEEEKKFLPTFKKELDQFMIQSKKDKPQNKTQSKEAK